MQPPIVIIGIGEMAGVFARGLLRCGHPLIPILRHMELEQEALTIPAPHLVLVAVAEADLQPLLEKTPIAWRDRLVLLQNELLPRDWEHHGLDNPTIISVWFEKKKGQDAKVLLPSPVFGPHAHTVSAALNAIAIPSTILSDAEALRYELVRKNVYILTINIAGLITGGTVTELWRNHQPLARAVADDVMTIQEYLVGDSLPRERLINGMLEAFAGDPEHKCLGRTASQRLERALQIADAAGLSVPTLEELGARFLNRPSLQSKVGT
ncbi:MAG: hypothetical protein HY272_06235 [Gammaproteobacteria bacterium]|nr:hypothetical protein [Gammaproteobacteria bacterium]